MASSQVIADNLRDLRDNEVEKENSMRNITLSVTDETYRIARIWAAQRDRSLSSVVEYLLRTLPNIERARQALPPAPIRNAGSTQGNLAPSTDTVSSTSAQKITPIETQKKLKFASETADTSSNFSI